MIRKILVCATNDLAYYCKTTKKIMKSEAMGTDLFDDSDISESYRRQDENSL